jgi:hypothetical protein
MDRAALLRRAAVALLLVYYIWILTSAWSMSGMWWWNPEEGLMWSRAGLGFFPIPFMSDIGAAVIAPAHPLEQMFYIMFMHCGLWIAWIALGLLYLFSPYRVDIRMLLDKIQTRHHDRSRR